MQTLPSADHVAFGEALGIDVPTRYPRVTHDLINAAMAADSAVTPMLLGMSRRVCWGCRLLVALLLYGRSIRTDAELRRQLESEIAAGVLCVVAALFGTRRLFERLYLLIGAVMLIGNALMTEIGD